MLCPLCGQERVLRQTPRWLQATAAEACQSCVKTRKERRSNPLPQHQPVWDVNPKVCPLINRVAELLWVFASSDITKLIFRNKCAPLNIPDSK